MEDGLDEVQDRGTMLHDLLILLCSGPPLILSFDNDTKVHPQGHTCKYTGPHLWDIIPMHDSRPLFHDLTSPKYQYYRILLHTSHPSIPRLSVLWL